MREMFKGEYNVVIRLTTEYDKLKESHFTPCSKEEALDIIKSLCKRFKISFKDGIWDFTSRTSNALGGIEYNKNIGKMVGYVRLPNSELKILENNRPYGLSVGLVLHEFSHVIQLKRGLKKYGKSHDSTYVRLFDSVLNFYYDKYK